MSAIATAAWEHKFVLLDTNRFGRYYAQRILDDASRDGWELVSVAANGLYFKRPASP